MASAREIDGIANPNFSVRKPIGGLGLTAAVVRITTHVKVILRFFPRLNMPSP